MPLTPVRNQRPLCRSMISFYNFGKKCQSVFKFCFINFDKNAETLIVSIIICKVIQVFFSAPPRFVDTFFNIPSNFFPVIFCTVSSVTLLRVRVIYVQRKDCGVITCFPVPVQGSPGLSLDHCYAGRLQNFLYQRNAKFSVAGFMLQLYFLINAARLSVTGTAVIFLS